MLRKTLELFLIFFLLIPGGSWNAAQAAPMKWVKQSSLEDLVDPSSLPQDATVQADVSADERLNPQDCPAGLFSNSENRKTWGRTLIQVQCVGSNTAPFFIYVDFKVWAPVLVTKEQVARGQPVNPNLVEYRTMNITDLKRGWVNHLSDLENKTAVRPIWPGTTLNHEMLKGRPLLKYGDTVKVRVTGTGFRVAGSAMALESAEKGDVVKIKTDKGKVLHGIAVSKLVVDVTL